MEDKRNEKIVLSIETSVAGGSLSILKGEHDIDNWTGSLEISKAEDILEQISNLLITNDAGREQVELICVSRATGSLTGEKIGQAIAKGLSRALNCRLIEISVLEALLLEVENDFEGSVITAAATGKYYINWQIFKKTRTGFFREVSEPSNSKREDFYVQINSIVHKKMVLHQSAGDNRELLSNGTQKNMILTEQNLAKLVGIRGFKCVRASDNVKGR